MKSFLYFLLLLPLLASLVPAQEAAGTTKGGYTLLGIDPDTEPKPREPLLATVTLRPGDAAAVPGKDYTAVIEIDHRNGYHSYWKNWGSAGLAPHPNWELPDGVEARPLEYAVPHRISTSGLPGYGYEGVTLHLVRFAIPDSAPIGEELTLAGTLDVLVCDDSGCYPLDPIPELELTVPIAAEAGEPSEELRRAREHQPGPVDWPAHWEIQGEELVLLVETPDEDTARRLAEGTYFSAETSATGSRTDLGEETRFQADGTVLEVRAPLGRATVSNGVGDQQTWEGLLLETPDGEGAVYRIVAEHGLKGQGDAPDASESEHGSDHNLIAAAGGSTRFWTILGGALLGGLILNVMPCVFPVLGLKVMGVANQAGENRRAVVLHGLVYTLGVLASFWVLTAVMIALQQGGQAIGVGFQLQNVYFLYGLVFVLFFFALNLAGLFEIGASLTGAGSGLQAKQGLAGSFFTGTLATVVATPCMAPFLGTALGAALALPPLGIFATFTAMGLGLALPFLLLSMFPVLVDKLPKPGAWMESFKVSMAFLMFGATGFLVFSYAGLVEAGSSKWLTTFPDLDAFLGLLLALTVLALGAWIYGRWGQQGRGRVRIWGTFAGLMLAGLAVASAVPREGQISWEPWSAAREAELREQGSPYFVDFTATWCATCQTNKSAYIDNARVIRLIEDKDITMLKADWTDRNDAIGKRLGELERAGVPTNILWYPGLEQPELFPDTFGVATMIEHFEEVPE